jgi:hypothetical protein
MGFILATLACQEIENVRTGPVSDNAGGLNGSLQHLLEVFPEEPKKLISFVSINSDKTKALFRF